MFQMATTSISEVIVTRQGADAWVQYRMVLNLAYQKYKERNEEKAPSFRKQ